MGTHIFSFYTVAVIIVLQRPGLNGGMDKDQNCSLVICPKTIIHQDGWMDGWMDG